MTLDEMWDHIGILLFLLHYLSKLIPVFGTHSCIYVYIYINIHIYINVRIYVHGIGTFDDWSQKRSTIGPASIAHNGCDGLSQRPPVWTRQGKSSLKVNVISIEHRLLFRWEAMSHPLQMNM